MLSLRLDSVGSILALLTDEDEESRPRKRLQSTYMTRQSHREACFRVAESNRLFRETNYVESSDLVANVSLL